MDDDTTPGDDETTNDDAEKRSLKEKIKKIDFKKLGVRAAIVGGVVAVTAGVIIVLKSGVADEED